jgi:IclR family mhp operon transcriptional activator
MENGNTIRALERGLVVLRMLEGNPGLSLHEISRLTKLAKPTLLRILRTLDQLGYVRRGLTDQLYYANMRFAASPTEMHRSVLAEVAASILDKLCQEVLWPSDLAVYDDGFMHVQETSRRRSPFMMNRLVTKFRIHMLQSGMGRAYLAYCGSARQDAIVAQLAASTDPRNRLAKNRATIERMIAEVRRKGYATRETGYFVTQPMEARVSAIAVPVMHDDDVLGSINLVWISQAATEEQFVERHLARLVESAEEIGGRFAARSPSRITTDTVRSGPFSSG